MNFSVVLRKAVDAEVVSYQVAGGKLGNVQSAIGTRGGYNLVIPQHLAGDILGDSSRYLRVAVGKQILAVASVSEDMAAIADIAATMTATAHRMNFLPFKNSGIARPPFIYGQRPRTFCGCKPRFNLRQQGRIFHYGTRPKVLFLFTVPRQNGMFYSAAPKQAT